MFVRDTDGQNHHHASLLSELTDTLEVGYIFATFALLLRSSITFNVSSGRLVAVRPSNVRTHIISRELGELLTLLWCHIKIVELKFVVFCLPETEHLCDSNSGLN